MEPNNLYCPGLPLEPSLAQRLYRGLNTQHVRLDHYRETTNQLTIRCVRTSGDLRSRARNRWVSDGCCQKSCPTSLRIRATLFKRLDRGTFRQLNRVQVATSIVLATETCILQVKEQATFEQTTVTWATTAPMRQDFGLSVKEFCDREVVDE